MEEKYLGCCGLCCENCLLRATIGPKAAGLRDEMRRMGFDRFGSAIPKFPEFWAFLSDMAEHKGCDGCGDGGGNPFCEARKCAGEKGVAFCATCAEYPCGRFEAFFNGYPMLRDDNQLLRTRGRETWEQMHEDRRRSGYTYSDAKERLPE